MTVQRKPLAHGLSLKHAKLKVIDGLLTDGSLLHESVHFQPVRKTRARVGVSQILKVNLAKHRSNHLLWSAGVEAAKLASLNQEIRYRSS
jgi:hypothetical protein